MVRSARLSPAAPNGWTQVQAFDPPPEVAQLVQLEQMMLGLVPESIQRAPAVADLWRAPPGSVKAGTLALADNWRKAQPAGPPPAGEVQRFSADEERTMRAAFTFTPGGSDDKNPFVRELWKETGSTDASHEAYSRLINATSYDHQDYITVANQLMQGRSPEQIMRGIERSLNPGSYDVTLEKVKRMQQMMQAAFPGQGEAPSI
jgi:hypothetical protein